MKSHTLDKYERLLSNAKAKNGLRIWLERKFFHKNETTGTDLEKNQSAVINADLLMPSKENPAQTPPPLDTESGSFANIAESPHSAATRQNAVMPQLYKNPALLENSFKPAKKIEEPVHTYTSGDPFFLWGRTVLLRIEINDISADKDYAYLQDDVLCLRIKRGASVFSRKRLVDTWYRGTLLRQMQPMMEQMYCQLGITRRVKIQLMKSATRWFTSNYTDNIIWVNEDMVKLDLKYLSYAVASELCVLKLRQNKVEDHELYVKYCAVMDEIYPQWKLLRKEIEQATALQ